ncbi:unnamed protein product, partial [Brenthis ino]
MVQFFLYLTHSCTLKCNFSIVGSTDCLWFHFVLHALTFFFNTEYILVGHISLPSCVLRVSIIESHLNALVAAALSLSKHAGRTSQNSRPGTRSGSQGAGGLSAGASGSSGGAHGAQAGASGSDNACASALPSRSSPSPSTSTGANTRNTNKPVPKVQLAKMRYGREEMLALYDRTTEAPEELKYFDLLYQPRGKPPVALNTFEEEMRDNIRGGPSVPMSTERFGIGRGSGRGVVVTDVRGRTRMPFVRNPSGPSSGRGSASLHSGNVKMPGFVGPDDEAASARPWSASNGGATSRTGDQSDWTTNKLFRRRQANNTNWRQTSRDEGDEWRNQEGARSTNRANLDKWDRDWSERPTQDRPQSWNSNRRTWGGDTQNEDNLPEWAVDNAEAGAGTFDSSGAFHGYSNDDSNLPKTQESPYQLTRSQTHGSFSRSKTVEEGSDEWWASEKAKKLSPKRFDTGEPKFKKPSNAGSGEQPTNASKKIDLNAVEELAGEDSEKANQQADLNTTDDQALRQKFSESKTFDALMRSDIGFAESNDERSNFQSVIITPNNSLRQKHQNIVSNEQTAQAHSAGLLHILHGIPMSSQKLDTDSKQPPEEKIVEELIDMTLEDTTLANMTHQVNSGITQMANSNMQMRLSSPAMPIMQMNTAQQIQTSLPIQNVGIPNQALNSSLGLPIGQGNNGIVMPLQGNLPVIQNSGLNSMGTMQSRAVMGGFQPSNGIPVMPAPNIVNNSLFMGQNNQTMPSSNDMVQNNLFPTMMHTTQPFASIYGNIMPQSQNTPNVQNLADQWYYEDPKKIIQGPFTSKDMYNWYRAGFFSPSLMVRRACDAHMRPLGSYGPVVPFAQLDVMSPFPMGGFESRPQGHDMLNQQPGLGIEDSLWGQPGPSQDLMWMQAMNARNEARVNNLPMFFWDSQPASAITSNSLLPEEIAKEMKTEDQILAQLRASQNIPTSTFLNDTSTTTTFTSTSTKESFPTVNATPELEKLQKLMPDKMAPAVETQKESNEVETKLEKPVKEQSIVETKLQTQKAPSEPKLKPNKEVEKQKTKDNGTKTKKKKEDKKEEVIEKKEEEVKAEKASVDSSPSKNKKEDKQSKKELEKEKKEWIKEGFTIVKGPEKNNSKENKKKVEEAKAAEDAERKKKEEEKLAAEEEKKKKIAETIKKQQDQQQRQIAESLAKKAPWSASQLGAMNKDGLTLAEIQRLEKEKKLEQMKEQQQMMQIIAQKQAEALATEQVLQEMQQNPAWAKTKKSTSNSVGPSIAAIQAETRRLSAAVTQPIEEPPLPQPIHAPWGNAQNGGFWDTQPNASKLDKPQEAKVEKKKKTISLAPKKETSPVAEFEGWCTTVLASWSTKIDVPTFVGFLRDIESPYEVKDYVKCYLGESKDSGDFARQFLEKRSKLLRVGTVTPSDDLCSPAIAVNPRASLSDYQEIKGKGKKSKKNKMLKVDARILGFSVTASEDRINVGDIDTV